MRIGTDYGHEEEASNVYSDDSKERQEGQDPLSTLTNSRLKSLSLKES